MNSQQLIIIFILYFLLISTSSFRLVLFQIESPNFSHVLQWYYPQIRRQSTRKYTFAENLRDRYAEGTKSGSGPGAVFYKIWNVMTLPYLIYEAYEDTKE